MNYSDLFLLRLIKRHNDDIARIEARLGVVYNNVMHLGGNILRDAPSDPEPAPEDVTRVWILSFRNQAPSKLWDNVNGTWI